MMHHLAQLQQCFIDRSRDKRLYKELFFVDVAEREPGNLYQEKKEMEKTINTYQHLKSLVMYSSAVGTKFYRIYLINCDYNLSSYGESVYGVTERTSVADQESFQRLNRDLCQWRAENGIVGDEKSTIDDEDSDNSSNNATSAKKPRADTDDDIDDKKVSKKSNNDDDDEEAEDTRSNKV